VYKEELHQLSEELLSRLKEIGTTYGGYTTINVEVTGGATVIIDLKDDQGKKPHVMITVKKRDDLFVADTSGLDNRSRNIFADRGGVISYVLSF
jgi:hypothetical protein